MAMTLASMTAPVAGNLIIQAREYQLLFLAGYRVLLGRAEERCVKGLSQRINDRPATGLQEDVIRQSTDFSLWLFGVA